MKLAFLLIRLLPPEISHLVALNALNFLHKLNLIGLLFPHKNSSQLFKFKGLIFKNRLGISAGLDKNGDYINSLGALGFGFIEIGTITPLAQSGNPKPRIFRLPSQGAIVNRLGFNNKGVDYLVEKVKLRTFEGVLGINIGANKTSEGQKRIDDYVECFNKVCPFADYIAVNISSPNTPNLRSLHLEENFLPLFEALSVAREKMQYSNPILIKLSPDEDENIISVILSAIQKFNFDGVITSNTTVHKDHLEQSADKNLQGGLSGKPLFSKSNDLLKLAHSYDPGLLKIGVGGVHDKDSFNAKLDLGASLVQIYTSFIYQGPKIVKKLLG
ncbi:quinone-dependent dihydroorotate dehydrogenase [Gammaproteobacteria bacterium]|nr:quinone-dependent dihydroorotate dehydrogenase [Gammaproteobacteria bacterium]